MVKFFYSTTGLDLGQLSSFWEPDLRSGIDSYSAEKCEYLLTLFQNRGFLGVCECDGVYVSVVRVEKLDNTWLIAGLETHPDHRKRGHAAYLLESVLAHLQQLGAACVISHVEKRNTASLTLHKKLGFLTLYDYAKYLDFTVTTKAYTLRKLLQ